MVALALMVKNPPAMWETGSISGLWRSPGRGHSNPLQYSCLENTMDRGAWQAAVQGVTKSQITEWNTHTHTHTHSHIHTHTHTHKHTLTHILSYSHPYSHSHTLTLILTHTHTLSHTPTHPHTHSHTYTQLLYNIVLFLLCRKVH